MATLPPWLQAARPAPLYAQGIGLGLQAAEQRQQAALRQQALMQQASQQAEEAMIAQQRMAVQQELAQQEMAMKQAEMEQAYGLKTSQLGLGEEALGFKIDQASRLAGAQQEYQRRVAAGESPEDVLAEIGPSIGTDTAYASLIRERARPSRGGLAAGPVQGQPVMGPDGKPIPGMIAVPSATGEGYTVHPVRPEAAGMSEFQRATMVDRIQKQADKLLETNPDVTMTDPDPEWSSRRKSSWESGRKSMSALEGRMRALEGGGADMGGVTPEGGAATIGGLGQADIPTPETAAPALQLGRVSIGGPRTGSLAGPAPAWPQQESAETVLPMPRTKAGLQTGSVYQTKFGPMEWNGSKFVDVTQ